MVSNKVRKILIIVGIVIIIAFFVALFCGVPTLNWTGWLLFQIFHWVGWFFNWLCQLLQIFLFLLLPWLEV